MTSDRGNSGGAELQLSTTPVTPKGTAGLNPNANVFQSKSPASPDSTTGGGDWQEVDTLNNVVTPTTESTGYSLANGDVGKLQPGVNFPPTPESPVQTTDYQNVNGTVSSPEMVYTTTPDSTTTTTSIADENTPLEMGELIQNVGVVVSEENGPLGNSVTEEELKGMLRTQLEYYFSRENLASDTYLVSQMDADQYVPISTVAGFNQVKRLTTNMDMIIDVLRASPNVQVDEVGEKVRPLHKRCIVILREVPESTPVEDVSNLFSGENCPRFISCEFAHNDSWYVTFDSDEDAQRAYQYLREEVQTFLGKPIMARIKAKPLLRTMYVPKNGLKAQYDPNAYQTQQRYTYPATTQMAANVQYMNGQQVSRTPRATYTKPPSYPFFQPSTVIPAWAAGPTPYFDPGMVSRVFAANGYTPGGTYKLGGNSGRHGFQSVRNRNQNKMHSRSQSGQDRLDNRTIHDRHQVASSVPRSSPRSESSQPQGSRRDTSHSQSHAVHTPQHSQQAAENNSHPIGNNRQPQSEVAVKDQTTQPARRDRYRSRRRREDEGAKSRQSISQSTTKESKPSTESPKFDLEPTSFPPLPGSTNSTTTGDIFENKMSDVVKGTAKPLTRDSKTQTPVVPQSPIKDNNANTAVNGAHTLPTPPHTPQKVSKSTSTENTAPSRNKPEQSAKTTIITTTCTSSSSSTATTSTTTTTTSTNTPSTTNAQAKTKTEEKPVLPVKLSYAQMAQRAAERQKQQDDVQPPKDNGSTSSSSTSTSLPKSHTLKEHAQTASVRSPTRGDYPRKEKEDPREQRPFSGRRAKENRDRRDRDRERDKDRRKDVRDLRDRDRDAPKSFGK